MAHLSNVAARVRQILDATDQKIAATSGNDLPDTGAELLTVAFTAEDKDDVAAVEMQRMEQSFKNAYARLLELVTTFPRKT